MPGGMARGNDRRGRARVALRCPVRVSRPGSGSVLTSMTRNVSSSGFYFVSSEGFVPGERVDCVLVIPAEGWGEAEERLGLRCRAEVARVEQLGQGRELGVACRIADYRVVQFAADVSAPAGARSA
jgi:hypothetical protein